MIITVAKPFTDVLANLAPYGTVFVVGCAACATKCQTGGEEAVNAAVAALTAAGKTVTGSLILDTPCDLRIVKRDLSRSKEAAGAEAILVLACGAGVQAVGANTVSTAVPGLDPVFVGTTERIGLYREFCSVCGECILDRTAGICPVSRCAKGLVNGPCGGVVEGKCEVDASRDCAWALIFERLKKQGKERGIVETVFAPRRSAKPKTVDRTGKKI